MDRRLALLSLTTFALFAAVRASGQVPAAGSPDFSIREPNGIDEQQFVRINGVEQWVTIRGRNRANPVVLVLGGFGADGPGAVASPFLGAFQPWEPYVTVVNWDQPGAGKTYSHARGELDPHLDADMILRDALTLTDLLRTKLHKKKIVLVGVGFGSTIAARLAHDHPERFAAYLAAGQIADPRVVRETAANRQLRALAEVAGDKDALADLDLSGLHPFNETPRDPAKLEARRRAASRYPARNPAHQTLDVVTAPNWGPAEAGMLVKGMSASESKFGAAWNANFDFAGLRGRYQVPVFVVQGDRDIDAPLELSRAWLAHVRAPEKALVVVPGAGDHAIQTDPAPFVQILRERIAPLAQRAER
ncbi:MAG TPA: alpha/beta hydrolase [Phenylobacterium sp.]|jgi:pimeloyl-ACP methyl ester carboxylesterase|nr:alpha/beta hydrolase [Phenylobacterium sp.]